MKRRNTRSESTLDERLTRRTISQLSRVRFAAGLVAATALAMSANGALAQSASQGKKILLLESLAAHPYVVSIIKTFKQRAAKYGMVVTVQAAGLDAALQARQIDDGIAKKFDLIAVQPSSEQGVVPALARAKQAGIPTMIVNNPPKDNTEQYYLTFVGQDQNKMGEIAGQAMLKAIHASGRKSAKIALITGSLQEGPGPRRVAGIEAALKADPNVKIVAIEDAHWDTATSERIAGQLFARFAPQGGLDGVYGMADNQSVAAIRAAQAAGISVGPGPKQLLVFGGNCLKEGLDAIAGGKMESTVLQSPMALADKAVDVINDYFAGKKIAKQILLPIDLIDKSNLDQFRAACTY